MASYAQPNPQAYPAPPTSYPPQGQMPYSAPPPVGYPTADTAAYPQQAPANTKNRGEDDGFWKGCCAALCCCCVLETCF
ncbi:cysteine-rich and transmembrane domain-containing protein A-like [Phalaenopsis equestris]|uniref:cysteine-rich and transmembrane domain-containing protein A-like n=1 Tax=Phalaenopsis equestris TaxID=78828 RepID=UPI0009E4D42B|nr:cysteine-rich and transmembrane domain-containing protein A-like [Phalaenopsis equestris]